MKVLLTGPDGILGNNLVRLLIESGYEVIAFVETGRRAKYLEGLQVEIVHGNILKPEDIEKASENCDVIIHAAAKTDTWPCKHSSYWDINVTGTRNVISAASKNRVKRLLHIGTANSFGPGSKANPGTEENPYEGKKYGLDYMCSKQAGQEEVLKEVSENDLDAVILNPTFMIGPYDSKPSSGAMIMAIYKGKAPGYPKGGRNFVYVKDVAKAIVNAISMGKKGECYILGNENLDYREIFGKIAKAVGVNPPKRSLPVFITLFYGRLMSFMGWLFRLYPAVNHPLAKISTEEHYYTSKKAVEQLHMPQTPIEFALEESVSWFRSNGYMDN